MYYLCGKDEYIGITKQDSKNIWKGWSPQLQVNYMFDENHSLGAFYKFDRHPNGEFSSYYNTDNYEKVVYEGYGPSGVAVIVETMTDNRNRTAGEVRHYFDKYGGNMGTANCVSWSFDKKGVIVIDNEDGDYDEDTAMMDALDAGAQDFEPDEDVFTVYTNEDDVASVADALTEKGYKLVSAQVEMLPQNGYIKLTNEDDIKNMQKMLDMFDDNDDVQNVWHNWEDAE